LKNEMHTRRFPASRCSCFRTCADAIWEKRRIQKRFRNLRIQNLNA